MDGAVAVSPRWLTLLIPRGKPRYQGAVCAGDAAHCESGNKFEGPRTALSISIMDHTPVCSRSITQLQIAHRIRYNNVCVAAKHVSADSPELCRYVLTTSTHQFRSLHNERRACLCPHGPAAFLAASRAIAKLTRWCSGRVGGLSLVGSVCGNNLLRPEQGGEEGS